MSGDRYVVDTSALFALIEDEPGADRVQEVLEHREAHLPWIVLLELAYITRQERGDAEAEARYALAKALPATVTWELDEAVVLTAARFKASHRVSLADAVIAAYARRLDAVLLHKDPEYEALTGEVALEALPYRGPPRP
ncbi:MAG: PIN domain-containing protein [Deferrisomatales bacterium]